MIEYTSPNYPNRSYNEYELESIFDDWLNEVEAPVTILGDYKYDHSEALKRIDPIMYRQCFLDWLDSEEFNEI